MVNLDASLDKCETARIGGFEVSAFRSVTEAADFLGSAGDGVCHRALVALNAEKLVANRPPGQHMKALAPKAVFYADGIAVVWLLRRAGLRAARVPGVELWEELMCRAGRFGWKVFLLGGAEDVNRTAADKLVRQYGISRIRRMNGYFTDRVAVIAAIRDFQPDIVTVAMGSPKQEVLIADAIAVYPSALYMGVGGTYDVFVGNTKRAPKWVRERGLEAIYRLLSNPSRLWRYRSLAKFAYLYVTRKI